MTRHKKPRVFHVSGRKWFDKVNGNTYHGVTVYADGEMVFTQGLTYGYGEHYIWTARTGLRDLGWLPGIEEREKAPGEHLWQYCMRKGINLVCECHNVKKRDL